ncbi:hypothetical protein G6F70_007884 [Rhizopus microsporus]|nr:hypothetical protein G6F71_007869 [Rhizopus microsporus]KAG1195893.1 hypothetical protein G6F70_007884 [Rhizopus microsporus]KAG1207743.1 hypothetical protein G6F69_007795 [Rhizopus microsporus]KAG1228664.1 hypothetical protein G6F67_007676 [Rhizopus microsporus]KAG1262606.1 hypothetical protein G6F68_005811 [Rhizopus microsporus]
MHSLIKSSQPALRTILNKNYGTLSTIPNVMRVRHLSSTSACKKDIESWKKEISQKSKVETDVITPSQVNLLGNTLDHPKFNYDQFPAHGTEIPPGWHLAYFPPRVPEKELAKDGYDKEWSPPEPYVRRKWAGGKLEWNVDNPLRVGDEIKMESKLSKVDIKKGNSVFVWVDSKIHNKQGLALTESRCWVYTTDDASKEKEVSEITQNKSSSHEVMSNPEFSFNVTPTPITLFRFSALTFNSHLIHYDHTFATQVEKQKGCLTHGPLSLIYMVNQLDQYLATKDADQQAGHNQTKDRRIKSFEYRCLKPLTVNEALTISGRWKTNDKEGPSYDLWIMNDAGDVAVKGLAIIDKVN